MQYYHSHQILAFLPYLEVGCIRLLHLLFAFAHKPTKNEGFGQRTGLVQQVQLEVHQPQLNTKTSHTNKMDLPVLLLTFVLLAVAKSMELSCNFPPPKRVQCICPSRGTRYIRQINTTQGYQQKHNSCPFSSMHSQHQHCQVEGRK